jgi:hypothetical protein
MKRMSLPKKAESAAKFIRGRRWSQTGPKRYDSRGTRLHGRDEKKGIEGGLADR